MYRKSYEATKTTLIDYNGYKMTIERVLSCLEHSSDPTVNFSKKYLSLTDFDAFQKILKSHMYIKNLDLSSNLINETMAIQIGEILETNQVLQNLNLFHNEIKKKGCMAIFKALKTNTTLIKLNISNNRISFFMYSAWETSMMIQYLKCNKTLKELRIGGNHIDSFALDMILKGIEVIEYLNISECNFETKNSIVKLSEFVQNNYSLQELYLDYSSRHLMENFNVFADALLFNMQLTKLSLSYCELRDEQCERIADILKQNQTITDLDLAENNITDQGALKIAEALEINTSLCKIYLDRNLIKNSSIITKAIEKSNFTIIEYSIHSQFTDFQMRNKWLHEGQKEKIKLFAILGFENGKRLSQILFQHQKQKYHLIDFMFQVLLFFIFCTVPREAGMKPPSFH